MCQYKSALVLQNGDLVHSDVTDSHEDLIAWRGLSDATPHPAFVRVEYTGANLTDIETYALRVDQDVLPPWWSEAMAADAARKLRAICERAIVREPRRLLLGGCWVLGDGAVVDTVKTARLITMRGSSQVGTMRDSSQVLHAHGKGRRVAS